MNKLKIFYLLFLIVTTTGVYAGPGEITSITSSTMGVGIENDGKKLVMIFEDNCDSKLHTVIDLERINDLEYKTRIMRYFGGMLKNDTYKFERIQVISGDQNFEMEFNRTNVSLIINSMLVNLES
jgi:hypothetical protein